MVVLFLILANVAVTFGLVKMGYNNLSFALTSMKNASDVEMYVLLILINVKRERIAPSSTLHVEEIIAYTTDQSSTEYTNATSDLLDVCFSLLDIESSLCIHVRYKFAYICRLRSRLGIIYFLERVDTCCMQYLSF